MEKLRHLVEHWIEHSKEHREKYEEWAERIAESNPDVALKLKEASEKYLEAEKILEEALKLLG
jgi:hypothetical protein